MAADKSSGAWSCGGFGMVATKQGGDNGGNHAVEEELIVVEVDDETWELLTKLVELEHAAGNIEATHDSVASAALSAILRGKRG